MYACICSLKTATVIIHIIYITIDFECVVTCMFHLYREISTTLTDGIVIFLAPVGLEPLTMVVSFDSLHDIAVHYSAWGIPLVDPGTRSPTENVYLFTMHILCTFSCFDNFQSRNPVVSFFLTIHSDCGSNSEWYLCPRLGHLIF